jgi:hypothetical protein
VISSSTSSISVAETLDDAALSASALAWVSSSGAVDLVLTAPSCERLNYADQL